MQALLQRADLQPGLGPLSGRPCSWLTTASRRTDAPTSIVTGPSICLSKSQVQGCGTSPRLRGQDRYAPGPVRSYGEATSDNPMICSFHGNIAVSIQSCAESFSKSLECTGIFREVRTGFWNAGISLLQNLFSLFLGSGKVSDPLQHHQSLGSVFADRVRVWSEGRR